jgi:hypothetical protein
MFTQGTDSAVFRERDKKIKKIKKILKRCLTMGIGAAIYPSTQRDGLARDAVSP